jgi:hypothetical protein
MIYRINGLRLRIRFVQQQRNKEKQMDEDIVWQSTITKSMVEGWTGDEIELLIADLNDSVQSTYEDYNIRDWVH